MLWCLHVDAERHRPSSRAAVMFDFGTTESLDESEFQTMLNAHADAIARAEASDVEGVIDPTCLGSGKLRIHRGDLVLEELHLASESPTLVVQGNLIVTNTIIQEFRAGFLIVFGDVRAKSIVTTALIFITGDLHVDTILGNCTNYSTDVLGKTTARVLVSAKEHYFCLYGGRSIDRIVDVYGDTPNLDGGTDGEEALVDGIDSGFDEDAVAVRLRSGGSLLRDEQPR